MQLQRFQLNGTNGKAKHRPAEPERPPTALEEKQALLAHMVRLVCQKASHGLFVAGPGGLGKSKTISETLASQGVNPVLLNSHVTPLSFYLTMLHNRVDQVLWLDDCDSIYGNMAILGLLRSALWGQGDGRVVTYTSTQIADFPTRFVFEGRIIFCANAIPKRNEAFKAVLSRVDVFELTASNDEILELMRSMATRGYKSLSPDQCKEVVEFIAQAGGTRQLSMRLYEPSMKKMLYAMKNNVPWRELVRSQLDQIGVNDGVPKPLNTKAHDMRVMAQALAAYPQSVKMQEEFWCKGTGRSRASAIFTWQLSHAVPHAANELCLLKVVHATSERSRCRLRQVK